MDAGFCGSFLVACHMVILDDSRFRPWRIGRFCRPSAFSWLHSSSLRHPFFFLLCLAVCHDLLIVLHDNLRHAVRVGFKFLLAFCVCNAVQSQFPVRQSFSSFSTSSSLCFFLVIFRGSKVKIPFSILVEKGI